MSAKSDTVSEKYNNFVGILEKREVSCIGKTPIAKSNPGRS